MSKPKQFSSDEAKHIGDSLGVDWDQVDLEQFRMGSPVTVSSEEQRQSPVVRFKKWRSLAPQKMFLNIEKG
jgi:hypothetical protein